MSSPAVKVTHGFFLVGLSNVESERSRNLQLLKERSWFDLPQVYVNQRRAIIAIEKGALGERAFNEAFAAWGVGAAGASLIQRTECPRSQPAIGLVVGVRCPFRKRCERLNGSGCLVEQDAVFGRAIVQDIAGLDFSRSHTSIGITVWFLTEIFENTGWRGMLFISQAAYSLPNSRSSRA